MNKIKMIGLSMAFSIWLFPVQAKITLPSLIGDHMVIQQQSQVKFRGNTSCRNSKITVTASWNKTVEQITSDIQGNWEITLSTPKAGYQAYELVFDDGEEKTTVRDVLVGEVWLASGQSNMEMPLKGFKGCPVENGLETPVGIVSCAYGGSRIEAWTDRKLLETYPDINLSPDSIRKMSKMARPMMMFNAMLYPVSKYTYKGIVWYQGESNVETYKTYAYRIANMVNQWRQDFKWENIPFYMVEVAPFAYREKMGAFLREAQHNAVRLIPYSGIVCTNDLVKPYELAQIHPCKKKQVGERLGLLALNKTYGLTTLACEGPVYNHMKVRDGVAELFFDHSGDGFNRDWDIRGFEIAGADKIFYPASLVSIQGNPFRVIVSSEKVPRPVAVRYCFKDFCVGNLSGCNGLPVAPFRTDDW